MGRLELKNCRCNYSEIRRQLVFQSRAIWDHTWNFYSFDITIHLKKLNVSIRTKLNRTYFKPTKFASVYICSHRMQWYVPNQHLCRMEVAITLELDQYCKAHLITSIHTIYTTIASVMWWNAVESCPITILVINISSILTYEYVCTVTY